MTGQYRRREESDPARVMHVGQARDTGIPLFCGTIAECRAYVQQQSDGPRQRVIIMTDDWTYTAEELGPGLHRLP